LGVPTRYTSRDTIDRASFRASAIALTFAWLGGEIIMPSQAQFIYHYRMSHNPRSNRRDENALWTISFGHLLSGLLFLGRGRMGRRSLLGTDTSLLIGLLVGMGGALYLVWLRFGRE
jgi:ATP synthase protein I